MDNPDRDIYGLEPSRPEDYAAMDFEAIRRRWDQKAERWDADLADEEFHLNEDDAYRRFLDTAAQVVAERAEFCCRRLLVDLACGTGLVLATLIGGFTEGLGIDLSERMIEKAARRQLPHVRYRVGNCFQLARYVSGAGAVVSRGVLLSHYGEGLAVALLQQISQALAADGGFALVDFLNAAARDRYPGNPENKTYYVAEQVESLGRQAGFRRSGVLGEAERRVQVVLLER